MRVLQLSYEIYPVVGGTSTLIQYLMEGMGNCECEIHLIAKTTDMNQPQIIRVANSYIHPIFCDNAEEMDASEEIKTQVKFLRKIKTLLENGETFRLIHIHDALPVDLIPHLRKLMDAPILLSYHINHHVLRAQAQSICHKEQKRFDVAYNLELKAATLCDYYMSASQATKRWLVDSYGIESEKIFVVPYGVSMECYPESLDINTTRKKLGVDSDIIILFVGRFVLQKGIDYLLTAFLMLLDELPEAKLILIGEGNEEEKIRETLTRQIAADRFEILDKMPFYELPSYYRCADAIVMPSIFEPFGMVAIEGMASKGLVIASGIDGLGELITDGWSGYQISVSEAADGTRAIDAVKLKELIYKAIMNQEESEQIRENAYRHACQNYSATKFAKEIYDVYRRITR